MVVGIALDGVDRAKQFRARHKLTYTIVVDDSDYADKYQIQFIPTNVIIDKDGKVQLFEVGANIEALTAKLDELVGK